MKNYRLYNVSDFILDEDFTAWVCEGKNDIFWKAWLQSNPDKESIIAEARQSLLYLKIDPVVIDKHEVDEEVGKLMHTIASVETLKPKRNSRNRWLLAASVIVLLGIGLGSVIISRQSHSPKFNYSLTTTGKQLVEQINRSDLPIIITLPDGSTVKLSPASRISYANEFKDSAMRDVYLSGEAFFNVTKNPGQPFRVFANGIVTKVLGTSFTVRAFEKEKTIKVTVRTGKVRVYAQSDEPEKTGVKAIHPDDVLLTPNQEVIFQSDRQKFQKAILEKPVIIEPGISLNSMVYEETPVVKVLEQFKKAYGISIVYDQETLKDCTITADLTDESLYSRLDLICKAIDASYEIINSEVFIRGKGCQ